MSNNAFKATHIQQRATVDTQNTGKRIDQVAALLFTEFSRERLKGWIASGELTLNDKTVKPKQRVKVGDVLSITAELLEHGEDKPENIPLNILYEDDALLVVNKPVGLVVHPGAGNWTGTLVNGLLHHDLQLAALPRAGLVHRIDKDTSGLLVVAKTLSAQQHLTSQLKDKSVYRHYLAVVLGRPVASGTVDAPIARHPTQRTKMAVVDASATGAKPAVSHFQTEKAFAHTALVSVRLETGRTHQIRVHMAHINHALVGDAVYGKKNPKVKTMSDEVYQLIKTFDRQALHAYKLGFIHPSTGENLVFEAPLPDDMRELVNNLERLDV